MEKHHAPTRHPLDRQDDYLRFTRGWQAPACTAKAKESKGHPAHIPCRRQAAAESPPNDDLIRRTGQAVQARPLWSVRWADVPLLSTGDRRCPSAWHQLWSGFDPRPCELSGRSSVAAAGRWLALVLPPLLAAEPRLSVGIARPPGLRAEGMVAKPHITSLSGVGHPGPAAMLGGPRLAPSPADRQRPHYRASCCPPHRKVERERPQTRAACGDRHVSPHVLASSHEPHGLPWTSARAKPLLCASLRKRDAGIWDGM